MHPLTELIRNDMKPALGVTEPGAIAYAVSTARSYTAGELNHVELHMNSGMYKNAYTCGIPHSSHFGNLYAAALGAVAGKPELGLESLRDVTAEDNKTAEILVQSGKITAAMSEISSRIHIVATVRTESDCATVTIWDAHTNITSIEVNGKELFSKNVSGLSEAEESDAAESDPVEPADLPTIRQHAAESDPAESADLSTIHRDAVEINPAESTDIPMIHQYNVKEILKYAQTVPAEEIEFIGEAFEMNYRLFEEGLHSKRTTYLHYLLGKNSGKIISDNELDTASLLCNGAIEARVLGLDQPAMSITGSGAHGIIATMPLYAAAKIRGYSDEMLSRATALSYLICMYIKEYSGKLSAFCGCAIAAGSGMACGLVYMRGGGLDEITRCLANMAAGITGMICDGGNHGCTLKGIAACDYAFRCADLALNGICIDKMHGIAGLTPEDTMRNMGRIASPGMVKTEETIVEIMSEKSI